MQVVTINSIQSSLSTFTYIFSVHTHKYLRDRAYPHFTNEEVGVKEITKLAQGHTAS